MHDTAMQSWEEDREAAYKKYNLTGSITLRRSGNLNVLEGERNAAIQQKLSHSMRKEFYRLMKGVPDRGTRLDVLDRVIAMPTEQVTMEEIQVIVDTDRKKFEKIAAYWRAREIHSY